MQQLKTVYQPQSLDEALILLKRYSSRARPLAGGTSLILNRSSKIEVLVDLRRAGLDGIEEQGDRLIIGAMVTCAALRGYPGALGEAAASVGSRILQSHVTVGGNCVMTYAWSDLPVALLCLQAEFVIQGLDHGAQQVLRAEELFETHPTRLLGDSNLLVEVRVPLRQAGQGSAYCKFTLNATDHSLVSVAARVTLRDETVQDARIVVGGLRGLPQLAADAAGHLLGKSSNDELLTEAGELAARGVKAGSDYRASEAFRRHLTATLVEDALRLAVRRAGGAS